LVRSTFPHFDRSVAQFPCGNVRYYKIIILDTRKFVRRSLQTNKKEKVMQKCLFNHVVHLNFRAGSTFPVLVCTIPSSMDRTSQCNKVNAVKLYASYRLNLLSLQGQRCVSSSSLDVTCTSMRKISLSRDILNI